MNQQINEPSQSSKNIWVIITFMVMVILMVGIGLYWLQKSSDKKETTITSSPSKLFEETIDTLGYSNFENWNTYINDKFLYSFKYPTEVMPYNDTRGEEGEPGSFVYITIPDPQKPGELYSFKIQIEGCNRSIGLKEYVEGIWKLNKANLDNIPNKKVGDIIQMTLDSEKIYQFPVTGSYDQVERGGLLDEEYLYTFFGGNNCFLSVSFPIRDKLSQRILETLEFIK